MKMISIRSCVVIMCSIIGLFSLIQIGCNEKRSSYQIQYTQLQYQSKTFIDFEYIFENESLNQPLMIRENPVTKEIIIMDRGNLCLYCFSPEGKFIRIIGRYGQGPGEFKNLQDMDIDKNGDIYTYDMSNNRVSIFSKEGKFVDSFRFVGSGMTFFTVSEDREIIFNNTMFALGAKGSDKYINVVNRNGKNIREIGEIFKYGKTSLNKQMAEGIPFKDKDNNYYIFLMNVGIVKKYNKSGELLKESKLEEVETIKSIRNHKLYNPPEGLWLFFDDVFFRDNRFYLLTDNHSLADSKNAYIYVLDLELNVVEKININSDSDLGMNPLYRYRPKFCILGNNEVLMTIPEQAKVLRFFK